MRKVWIGTGWKMNKVLDEAEPYLQEILEYLKKSGDIEVNIFLVPPFTLLRWSCRLTEGMPLLVGAQNMHWEKNGAYTGEVSPTMIKDCGADLVELGHSERRAMFGETDFTVNKKVNAALRHELRPLVCSEILSVHLPVGMRLLDPACGCGNFLVVSYREMRKLELEILKRMERGRRDRQEVHHMEALAKIDVDQMYGIEIEEWPARIAEVAMWLMDHQMNLVRVRTRFYVVLHGDRDRSMRLYWLHMASQRSDFT